MSQQDTLDQVYDAIGAVAELIDNLAGDGRGLSMAQINQGAAVVLALGTAEADIDRLGETNYSLETYQEVLARSAEALRGAKTHVASYSPTGALAAETAAVNTEIDEALAAIAAALV